MLSKRNCLMYGDLKPHHESYCIIRVLNTHRTDRNLSRKREGIINVVEVEASPYILTLFLSFVLSDYWLNLMKGKLKKYIVHSRLSRRQHIIYKPLIFMKNDPTNIWHISGIKTTQKINLDFQVTYYEIKSFKIFRHYTSICWSGM